MTAPPRLTTRQREILSLMAQGHLTKTAAIEMGISFETAKRHLKDARHSLCASTTTPAVALFLRGQEVA